MPGKIKRERERGDEEEGKKGKTSKKEKKTLRIKRDYNFGKKFKRQCSAEFIPKM